MAKFKKILAIALVAIILVGMNGIVKNPVKANIPTNVSNVELMKEDVKWVYLDDNTDPNVGTWYEEWNKRNGWAYPLDFLDWGTIPMRFTEDGWTVGGVAPFSLDKTTYGGTELKKKADGTIGSTYFFRYTFTIDKPEDIVAIAGKVRYNDAIIMYVNGKPVESLFNIPISNYSKNLEYGSTKKVTTRYIEEDFVVEDVSSLRVGLNTISVELHTFDEKDTDAYFELLSFVLNPSPDTLPETAPVKAVAVNAGTDESEINFAWYSLSGKTGKLQIAKKSDLDGDIFPVDKAVSIDAAESGTAYTKFYDKVYYYNKAIFNKVERGVEYIYRVGNDDAWSETYPLYTRDISEGYEVLFLSDAQIGTGTIPTDKAGWERTLNNAFKAYPNFSFIANTGDMVDVATKEGEYDAYFSPSVLMTIPSATAVGNHDIAANYKYHYNEPNLSGLGANEANSDYYFEYGDVLYLVLNGNNTNNAEHIQFMRETMEKMGDNDYDWTVLMMHQSIYSAAKQSTVEVNILRREQLVPVIDELGIDIALMGHDHCYVRTHHLKNFEVMEQGEVDSKGFEINPKGTLYLTTSSASGSKYYDLVEEYDYSAKQEQLFVPTFSHLSFTKDTFTMTAHRADTMEVIDTYKMKKVTESTKPTETPKPIETTKPAETTKPTEPTDTTDTSKGSTKYYTVIKGDTMTKIAKRYNTTPFKLQKLNPKIRNIDLIYVNQRIRVK